MKTWKELDSNLKRFIIVAAAFELLLLIGALIDISRQPSNRIKGSKIKWLLISLIDFFGPISYFLWGKVKTE